MAVSEHKAMLAFPLALLVFAGFIFAFNEIVDAASDRVRCFVPQEFTPEWSRYAHAKCSELSEIYKAVPKRWIGEPSRANKTGSLARAFSNIYNTPFLLMTVAFVLLIPLGVKLLLDRCLLLTRSASEENEANRSPMPIINVFVTKAVLVLCLGICLGLVENFTATKLSFSARDEAGALLTKSETPGLIDMTDLFYFCTIRIKKLGQNLAASYTLQCAISQRASFVTARLSALATWIALVFHLTWSCVSLVLNALLLISPTVRQNLRSGSDANKRTEPSMKLQPMMPVL